MPSLPRLRRTLAGLTIAGLAATIGLTASSSTATTANPVTPGDMTGYGFDQCEAPSQSAMTTWLKYSPFRAVGIYMSGSLRFCQAQTNLTPTWVSTQLATGWRLLPIHLGAQASCTTRDRYQKNKISADPADSYAAARSQGRSEAKQAVAAAQGLGIVAGSTLYYDLEAFNASIDSCKWSSLWFLSAWTRQIHANGYDSGVYSSAASGIKVLDDARVERPNAYTLPDMIWIARWDEVANTSTSYIRGDGWRPGGRVKQYMGGHNETWGGVTINIDRNYLDVGRGNFAPPEQHCGGVNLDFGRFPALREPSDGSAPPANKVRALQCLLQERRLYGGKLSGNYNPATIAAVQAWQESRGFPVSTTWSPANWVGAFAQGKHYAQKVGSTGFHVRRVQRALNAADPALLRAVTGIFTRRTAKDVRAYQHRVGLPGTGIVNERTWARLRAGRR
jgi:hypothetical protein